MLTRSGIKANPFKLIDNKRRYMIYYEKVKGNVYQISSLKPIEVLVQLAFYIIFNIHTQVKYVRRELKWLATSLILSL